MLAPVGGCDLFSPLSLLLQSFLPPALLLDILVRIPHQNIYFELVPSQIGCRDCLISFFYKIAFPKASSCEKAKRRARSFGVSFPATLLIARRRRVSALAGSLQSITLFANYMQDIFRLPYGAGGQSDSLLFIDSRRSSLRDHHYFFSRRIAVVTISMKLHSLKCGRVLL